MLKTLLRRLTGTTEVQIPDELWLDTINRLRFLARLDDDERRQLRRIAGELLGIKEMAAAGGLELTAAIQVDIAAQAALPILKLGVDWYRGWTGIIVYPDEFLVPRQVTDDAGVVHEFVEPLAGEAWDRGPLLLSWADAQRAARGGEPYAVVIHEFAHKIDLLDGAADGIPPFSAELHSQLSPARWRRTLDAAHQRLVTELELIESELPAGVDPDDDDAEPFYSHLPLDPYAAQDPAEFFAVSSEAFFVEPAKMQRAFPDWYELLAEFYRQQPLGQ